MQKTSVRAFAGAFLAAYAENWVYLDSAEWRIILIRNPEHAVFDRAVFDACGRTSASSAALGDQR